MFDFHAPFEALRARGTHAGMQDAVRRRDLAAAGSLDPVLASFGEASEARQYSGRAVGADRQRPFRTGAPDRTTR